MPVGLHPAREYFADIKTPTIEFLNESYSQTAVLVLLQHPRRLLLRPSLIVRFDFLLCATSGWGDQSFCIGIWVSSYCYTVCAGNPLHPIHTGKIHIFQSLSPFLSLAFHYLSSHGTMTMMTKATYLASSRLNVR